MTEAAEAISRFTPSLMSHELLERLFVARERTLDAIMVRVDAAATSTERNHTLLVGPRGSGKTHLVSLVYHRTNERRRDGAALQSAWLPEDPWTIVSYRHLLAAIVERLEPKVEEDVPRSADELKALLARRAAAHGPAVVLVENLDQILDALGDEGQQRLRHLLQADRSLLLVATSTRLDRALSDQASPFYGFFTTTRLEPFDVDEAAAMLTAVAKEREDQDLVSYLESPEGRARLCTITHLAGGQPRMWAALASALDKRGLDELIQLLLTRFDDLTPYYQEQLGRLSAQQRLVVAELAELDRPINVRELAERLEIDQRSLAKTMSELVDRGWAAATASPTTAMLDQRRTYYELAEPLARLSFQIKESRGEPLRLVVEFLKHWFDPTDLSDASVAGVAADYVVLATAGQEKDPVVAVTRRLQRLPVTRAPAVALLAEIDDALASLAAGDPEPFMRLPMPVRAALEDRLAVDDTAAVRLEVHRTAQGEFGHVPHPAMARWLPSAENLIGTAVGITATHAQLELADWLGRAWRFDESAAVLAAAADVLGSDHPAVNAARAALAFSLWEAGRTQEAIALEEAVVTDSQRVLGSDHPATLSARNNLALSYRQAGRTQEAIDLLESVLDSTQRMLGPEHPETLTTRNNLAISYQQAGRTRESIDVLEAVLDDRQRILGTDHPDTLTTRNNLASSYWQAGRTEKATQLFEAVLDDRKRILGTDHPETLTTRNNLASSYWQAGRLREATDLLEEVLRDSQSILGSDHPDTLRTRNNLATCYSRAGRLDEAMDVLEAVLEDSERLLGPDHPSTLLVRDNLADCYREAGRTDDAVSIEKR